MTGHRLESAASALGLTLRASRSGEVFDLFAEGPSGGKLPLLRSVGFGKVKKYLDALRKEREQQRTVKS